MVSFLLDAVAWALRLFIYSVRLLPFDQKTTDEDVVHRHEIAKACAEATSDKTEMFVCMKIARFESNYRKDVATCEIKGTAGELSAWQILPRGKKDTDRLCKSFVEDARLALERVRESRNVCRHLPLPEQLSFYARGNCETEEAKKLSRTRWPSEVVLP